MRLIVMLVVGLMGTLQALETIKLLVDPDDVASPRLRLFDGLELEWTELALSRRPDCPVCGD